MSAPVAKFYGLTSIEQDHQHNYYVDEEGTGVTDYRYTSDGNKHHHLIDFWQCLYVAKHTHKVIKA